MVPAAFGLVGSNVDWIETAFVIVLLVISLGVHEAAHAWSAWKLGDSTAKDMGRMTLNPLVHIDPFMSIILPALCAITGAPIFGGAKPVPVNFNRLRNPWPDMGIVAFAGPLSNLLLACLFFALFKLFVLTGFYNDAAYTALARENDLLPRIMMKSMQYNVLLFVFNLIPIPPLDGSRIMANALPLSVRENYVRIGGFGLVLVFMLINYVRPFQVLVFSVLDKVEDLVKNIVTLGNRW
ncbi:MAG: site-2 protease family protein [Planctomycetota bacterium]|nr:site-2 protease family protein [Planctomycetota bacterium]